MSIAADVSTSLSHKKYFALEEQLQQKHEYIAGDIFAMSSVSVKHSLIGTHTTTAIEQRS